MKIHHLNCGSMRQLDPTYDGPASAPAVNHCLLVETPDSGLVLVETGLGLDNIRRPADTLGAWAEMTEPVLHEEETAIRQIARKGFDPNDVRHVIVTHLDVDHCGGLPDFPQATVHVLAAELHAATTEAPSLRYRPAHWAHSPRWRTYESFGDQWFGFTAVQPTGLPEEIKLVPLSGHTAGHTGVAVHNGSRWLLHCGDAYYYHRELNENPEVHPVLDIVQTRSEVDHDQRVDTQSRLRILARDHAQDVTLFSAHDPWEFSRLAS